MSILEPIKPVLLFSQSEEEILRQIQAKVLLSSQGLLDDFSPASPLSALTEGQAYAIAYLGETINKIPQETLIRFLEVLGVTRSTARKALVPIEFTLTQGFGIEVKIPRGFRMFTDAGIVFTLNEDVFIAPDYPRTIGYATSIGVGSINNVEENTINGFSLAIPGLQSINNPLPARGGEDTETLNNMISRSLSFLSFRHLVSTRDFEDAVRLVVGSSYQIKAYSYEEVKFFLYNNDPIDVLNNNVVLPENSDDFVLTELDPLDDLSRTNVYLVVSDNTGQNLNSALQNKVQNFLLARLAVGTKVVFIPPEKTELYISLVVPDETENANISRLVNSLKISQSALYQQIGQDLQCSNLLQNIERFTKVSSFTFSLKDAQGNAIVDYTQSTDVILAPRPNVVFVLKAIEVRKASESNYDLFTLN